MDILITVQNTTHFILDQFEGDSPVLQAIGKWASIIYGFRPMAQMELHLILAALFPIVIGAHASLKRPPSAGPPEKDEEDEEDELDAVVDEPINAGLTPSDAILFPLTAGLMLGGLYYAIVWLKKADLVNIIMNGYLSIFGVFGVGRLAADALNVLATFIFPSVWSSSSETFYVEPLLSEQVSGPVNKTRILSTRKNTKGKTNPFPGYLSNINFSDSITKKLWALRALLKDHWIFRGYVHGVFKTRNNVRLTSVIGFTLGLATVLAYNMVPMRSWWLTNILGMNFCYGVLQILSPTTFWTGTLVLAGLFVYDIVMVFYTPMMITVAKSLEAPIMLMIPGPGRGSMLGLGDVVLPGIVMAMALRFDLYLHYLHKQKTLSLDKTSLTAKNDTIKAPYVDATGVWGERFWAHRSLDNTESTVADGARFRKVYFKASIIGYIFAMLVTMAVMFKYKQGQPALLYLVPGVLGAIWGTAAVRGEAGLMWNYSEDGEWGFEDEKKDRKGSDEAATKSGAEEGLGKVLKAMRGFSAGNGANGLLEMDTAIKDTNVNDNYNNHLNVDKSVASQAENTKDAESSGRESTKKKIDGEHAHHIFLFSLSTPQPKKRKGLLVV